MTESENSRWVDVTEMVKILGVPRRTCQRWLVENHAGLFPSAKKARPSLNSKLVVLRSEVEAAKSQLVDGEIF